MRSSTSRDDEGKVTVTSRKTEVTPKRENSEDLEMVDVTDESASNSQTSSSNVDIPGFAPHNILRFAIYMQS